MARQETDEKTGKRETKERDERESEMMEEDVEDGK